MWTVLRNADVNDVDFSQSVAWGTSFDDLDLRNVRGLETIRHTGPSTIGSNTIYRSKGEIPEGFLRGCGVPDELITFAQSMRTCTIRYYSCFISHSSKDKAFAALLYADLQAKGVRCWLAPHDIKGGQTIREQVEEAIRRHDKLLLILSEHSMASDWVGAEIASAVGRGGRRKKKMLFPITITPIRKVERWKLFDAGKDLAKAVREYHIPDFSGWQRDREAYQREFEKLVAALKAEASGE